MQRTYVSADNADSENDRPLPVTHGSVLLVEDDEDSRIRVEALLAHSAFDVMSVGSVLEAREAMAALVFPMVIIDRLLGRDDGIQLVREFRQRYKDHRVFLMLYSALDSVEEQQRGLQAGADAYISKHTSDELLVKTLCDARGSVRLVSR